MGFFSSIIFKTNYNIYRFKNKNKILNNMKNKYIYVYFRDINENSVVKSYDVIYVNKYEYKNIIYRLNQNQKIIILNKWQSVTHIFRYLYDLKFKVYMVK